MLKNNQIAFRAIMKLVPNADCTIGETYESIGWSNESREKPTKAEFDTAMASITAEYDANQYQRDRATAFPTLADQADMQYWDLVNGTTTWKDAIAKVKADNPKE